MSDTKLCAEMLRRIFPRLDIGEIKTVETQKTEKLELHIRGVRFDVFTKTARDIFDIEAQNKKLGDLIKRPRAYHIVIGYDGLNSTLKTSGNYKDLPDAYVVFICTFDPFKKGRHIYSFQNYCTEDKNIALGDGAYTVFLNTKGEMDDVSPELKRFLDFIEKNKTSDDSFIKELDEKIKEAKSNTEWRREYMVLLTIEDEKFAEGRAEGEKFAQRSIYERLIANGKLSPEEASYITGWNCENQAEAF